MGKKKTRHQVTCKCSAYSFPHRLGGGKCTGDDWTRSYYIYDGEMCSSCCLNHDGQCQVSTGQESIVECDGYLEHLRSQSYERHPITEEDLIQTYEDHYECG